MGSLCIPYVSRLFVAQGYKQEEETTGKNQQIAEPVCGQAKPGDIKEHHVRFDGFRLNATYLAQALDQDLCILVVFRQALYVVSQGIHCSSRYDACLSHGTPKLVFPAPCLLNEGL